MIFSEKRARYVVVGGINTLIGYALFVLLFMLLGAYVNYVLILLMSHVVSVTGAYILYNSFVFRGGFYDWGSYVKFHLVYIGVLGINIIGLPALVEVAEINVLFSQAIMTICVVIFSYYFNTKYVFQLRDARKN